MRHTKILWLTRMALG